MNWLIRLWFFVFTFIYCLAVFEVNSELIANTWGDEYDLYIHNGASSNATAKLIKIDKADSPVVVFNSTSEFPDCLHILCSFSYFEGLHPDYSNKRYIIHRALLI